MIEAGVVIDNKDNALYWHLPAGRSGGSIPDNPAQVGSATEEEYRKANLWYVMWDNRADVGGFAHSHPGHGMPGPSYTDLTTFAAIEEGLGKRLDWYICSSDRVIMGNWWGPDRLEYRWIDVSDEPYDWLIKLREESGYHK